MTIQISFFWNPVYAFVFLQTILCELMLDELICTGIEDPIFVLQDVRVKEF